MSEIQKAHSKKRYFDIDFDNVSLEFIKESIDGKINQDCLTFLETRGGFSMY